jgi:hypothetical protein
MKIFIYNIPIFAAKPAISKVSSINKNMSFILLYYRCSFIQDDLGLLPREIIQLEKERVINKREELAGFYSQQISQVRTVK